MSRRTPTPSPQTTTGQVPRYRDRIYDDLRHDPYQSPGKYTSPTRCSDCGAVYDSGRWHWRSAPERAHMALCPACRRTRDALPAGVLVLDGPYVAEHRLTLLGLARNEAEQERHEHPLNRIMHVDEHGGRIEISTTDIHLPQRIGEAVKSAHHGELTVRYAEDEYGVRVEWRR